MGLRRGGWGGATGMVPGSLAGLAVGFETWEVFEAWVVVFMFALLVGVNFIEHFHRGFKRIGRGETCLCELFVQLLRGEMGEFGEGLAFKMGRVFAGFHFREDGRAENGGWAAAETGGEFGVFDAHQDGGGQFVALTLFEGLGAVVVHLLAQPVPALIFDFEVSLVLLAAAEIDDGLTVETQGAELVQGGFVQLGTLGGEDGGHAKADGVGEMVGHGRGLGDGLEVVPAGGEVVGVVPDFFVDEPVLVTALTPVGEVLFGDGAVVEELGEGFLDLRQGVEPLDEDFAFGAILQAGVELSANIPGEPGDFTDTGHSNSHFLFHDWFVGESAWNSLSSEDYCMGAGKTPSHGGNDFAVFAGKAAHGGNDFWERLKDKG